MQKAWRFLIDGLFKNGAAAPFLFVFLIITIWIKINRLGDEINIIIILMQTRCLLQGDE